MQLTFDIDLSQLNAKIQSAVSEMRSPTRLLKSVGETLLQKNQARHSAGQAPDGTAWKPLAQSTLNAPLLGKSVVQKATQTRGARSSLAAAAKIKAKQANRRILYEHGDLLDRWRKQVDGDTLRVGTNDKKAAWHHYGTKPYTIRPKTAKALGPLGIYKKRVNHPGLPARPLVGFPDTDKAAVQLAVTDYLETTLKKA